MSQDRSAALDHLLHSKPARDDVGLPVTTRIQELPLNALSWENFERLCTRLVATDHEIVECHRYGLSGDTQLGVDIIAYRRADAVSERVCVAYQCKRWQEMSAADLGRIVQDLAYPADRYVVMISLPATTAMRDVVARRPDVDLWSSENISNRLKHHAALVEDFFGSHWREAFCGSWGQATYTPPPPPDLDADPPDRGPLPPGSPVPFAPNALFTGRTEALKTLARTLLHDQAPTTLITQAIHGMGGIGKTQLAVEFAYRYGLFFHGVHWIHAAQPEGIGVEIAACGAAMSLPRWPDEQPEQIARTLQEWSQGEPRLVVLDNLEDIPAAREWLARLSSAPVRLLLTARRSDWPADLGLSSLGLVVFTACESRAFLRGCLPEPRPSAEELDALAERLGCLPLALELAGRYLAHVPTTTIPVYLTRLETVLTDRSMQTWRVDLGNPTGHDLDLAATFRASWDQVTDETARRLFLLAGHCAANEPIPWHVLQHAVSRWPEAERELDQAVCVEALAILTGLGLLKQVPAPGKWDPADAAGGVFIIHPLLAEYAHTLEGAQSALTDLASALTALSNNAYETGLPIRFAPLGAHMRSAVLAAERDRLDTAATLWNNLGYYRRMVADYAGAHKSYKRALAIAEAAFGPDHPQVATIVGNLGNVLRALGDLPGARAAFERALTIDEAAFGCKHPGVSRDLSNLGSLLRVLGDLEAARAALERALRIDGVVYSSDHPEVARHVNNLGLVLYDLGDLEGARQGFDKALIITERFYASDHPDVAIRVNNLGLVLHALGDLTGARCAFQRALAIAEAAYGPDHASVALYVNNLGLVLKDLGDLTAARESFGRALRIWEATLPADHPSIQTVRRNLQSLTRT